MIFVDSSEIRSTSKMPYIDDAVEVIGLEELTGADFMVSSLKMPATTKTLIYKHIEAGAYLVQRKHGHDLISSIGERLNNSLAKMRSTGAKQSQCVLLFIGVLSANEYGEAVINRRKSNRKFWTVMGAINKWNDRGGVVDRLSKVSYIEPWCYMKERHLEEYAKNPVKEVWKSHLPIHEKEEMFQTLQIVNDFRNTLVTLPGIGPKTANILWEEFEGNGAEIISWLTSTSKEKKKIYGVGDKTVENIREWMKLQKRNWLNLDILEKEK